MRAIHLLLIALSLLIAEGGAHAHGDWPARHGGLKNDDGGEVSFELVVRGREVVIHLEDHGEPMSAIGARGVLQLTRADVMTTMTMLRSIGGNRLAGRAAKPFVRGDRLVVKLNFTNGSIAEGRFTFK